MDSLSEQFSEMFRVIAPKVADRLSDFWSYPFLTEPGDRLYSLYLISFFLIGGIVYFARGKNYDFRLSSILAFLLPKSVYLDRSAIVDYKYYVVNRIFSRFITVVFIGISFFVFGEYVKEGMTLILGKNSIMICDVCVEPAIFLYGVALFFALDFGSFISHYLHHKVPVLWEFHKVHHSAAVLTPITLTRVHPLEYGIQNTSRAIFAGVVNGVFGYFLADKLAPPEYLTISFLNISVIYFCFNIFANLRHSHIWLSYGYKLNHAFISPAQHQIHHSCETKHWDKNFGSVMAIWDWIFGTLYVPRTRESFSIGLPDREHERYDGVIKLYALPFIEAARLIGRRMKLSDRVRN